MEPEIWTDPDGDEWYYGEDRLGIAADAQKMLSVTEVHLSRDQWEKFKRDGDAWFEGMEQEAVEFETVATQGKNHGFPELTYDQWSMLQRLVNAVLDKEL